MAEKLKEKWISAAIDDELFNCIERVYKARAKSVKKGERKISKSDVIREALRVYFQPESVTK